MKLPQENLTVKEQLEEFDQWLTPKLERIKDTDKFNSEVELLSECIKTLSKDLNQFIDMDLCSIDSLVEVICKVSSSYTNGSNFFEDEASLTNFYISFFNLLFLATGATDNNLKNHFLIKLKEDDISSKIPKRGTGKKNIKFSLRALPSTTTSDYIAKLLASCYVGSMSEYDNIVSTEPTFSLNEYLKIYLAEYISLILEDEEELLQLWVICKSFIHLSKESKDMARLLINSCTIFKVRGSVSASGGHIPENLLREKLVEIGLIADRDFNTSDAIVGEEIIEESGKRKKKTRAYDFILPYKIETWEPKLFIQSQFYAGDSGSLSHKVVDQTSASRDFTKSKYPSARFIEYLDGAGYFASLRGDLEHMLTMEDTHSFIQVKSILIRLRREFQSILFLTPVEFEHAIIETTSGNRREVLNILLSQGYSQDEISRVENDLIERNFISIDSQSYKISPLRIEYARKLFLLDIAGVEGYVITAHERKSGKFILLPGFGAGYGLLGSTLATLACEKAKFITITPTQYEEDLEWLIEEKVISRK